jgi:hypothetical protein
MKDAFSLISFAAAALCLAAFLTTFPSEESGWGTSAPAALQLSGHGNDCRLRGPLFADVRGGIDVLSRLRDV